MDCEIVRQSLLEYSRQRLNSPEASSIKAHLDGCKGCRSFLKEEKEFDLRLSQLAPPVPMKDVWGMIHSATHKGPFGLPHVLVRLRGVLAAGAAVTVAAGAMFFALPLDKHRMSDQELTVRGVLEQQAETQLAQKWIDDPLGSTTDLVVAMIEEEL